MGARNPWDEMPETVPGAAVERQLGAGRYAFHTRTSAVSWWGSFMLLGKCLDVTEMSTASNARLQIWSCTGTANQQFHLPV